jgi:hypothetical protein
MRWAVAYAFERLFVLALIALLFVCVFHAADGGADAYVDQVNRWLGFDALTRALEHSL